jgi:hypothetical protein
VYPNPCSKVKTSYWFKEPSQVETAGSEGQGRFFVPPTPAEELGLADFLVSGTVRLGRLFGKEERAQQVVDFYLQQVNAVYGRVEKLKEAQPSVFLFRVASLPECCPSFRRSTLGLLTERAGGINIGAQRIPGHTGVLNPSLC